MTITCNKCGIVNGFIKEKGTQTGLYCNKCGKWIKWLTKDEIRLFNFNNTDSLNKKSYTAVYNKAIDDFVKFASDMPTVEEEDGTIRPMWLEEIAEQLKVGEDNV